MGPVGFGIEPVGFIMVDGMMGSGVTFGDGNGSGVTFGDGNAIWGYNCGWSSLCDDPFISSASIVYRIWSDVVK